MTSDRSPDYRVRPAKAVVRRVLLEAFERLRFLGDLSEFDYYGFGSYSFVDFNLFHRRLKLLKMVSMEREPSIVQRARFNCPFSCVTVDPREASVVLPSLTRDRKRIIWLDYTWELNETVLRDVRQVCAVAAPGTFFVVTVRADEGDDPDHTAADLEKRVGADLAPRSVTTAKIAGERYPHVLQGCVEAVILKALREQNATKFETPEEMRYHRVLGLAYSDTTPMLCTGGVIHSKSQSSAVDNCQFDQLDLRQAGEDPIRLHVPKLTPKEVWFLNSLLPKADWSKLEGSGISREEAQEYLSIYRYYPPYVEVELY